MASGKDWAQPWSVMAMLVTPGGGLLHGGSGIRQGVHVGHVGVQMQLHPFFSGGIQPLGRFMGQDRDGVQDHFVVKPVYDRFGQYLHPIADGSSLHNCLGLGRSRSRKYRLMRMEPV